MLHDKSHFHTQHLLEIAQQVTDKHALATLKITFDRNKFFLMSFPLIALKKICRDASRRGT